MLPQEHPFVNFNKYLYLESGTPMMPIYIFKFGDEGIMTELHMRDKENGPRGRLYRLKFANEYDFKIDKVEHDIVKETFVDLFTEINKYLAEEVNKHYGESR